MDARRKQCAHADYFTRDNVAIATVYGGDGLRYCTLTLYGVARRSVLCQLEPRHIDVSCSCAPARAQDVRCLVQWYDIVGKVHVANGQRGAVRHGSRPRPDAAEKEARSRSTRLRNQEKRNVTTYPYIYIGSMPNASHAAAISKAKNELKRAARLPRRKEMKMEGRMRENGLR